MQIEFVSVRWKNFLSYGNKWTEITFPSGFRSIRGCNGAGKSSIVDALFYGLFGKTYREVKMDELVNRLNGKDMLVEVTFRKNGDEWKILRGRMPNVLEITKNGKPVELLSSKALVQNELDDILGIDQELFKRIVILSIGLTKPFMTMSAQDQREFLSDVFNLGVFSKMSSEVKKRISSLKVEHRVASETKTVLGNSLENAKKNRDALRKTNENLRNNKETDLADLKAKKAEESNAALNHWGNFKAIEEKLEELRKLVGESSVAAIDALKEELAGMRQNARQIIADIGFLGSHDECPTCGQKIDNAFKTEKLKELEARKSEIGKDGVAKKAVLEGLIADEENLNKRKEEVRRMESELRTEKNSAELRERSANMIEEQISKLEQKSEIDLTDADNAVEDAEKEFNSTTTKFKELEKTLNRQKKMVEILSDDGVRGYYIEKYVGVVNSIVNRHLREFGIGFEFVFSSSLEAKLKTNREEVNYMSCSEGEKKRIDMSVLLAFMEITKVLSNWSCNVVFFDELFDSSVDDENLKAIVGTVKQMVKNNNQCAYVITHRHLQEMDFDGHLEITKQARFSKVEVL